MFVRIPALAAMNQARWRLRPVPLNPLDLDKVTIDELRAHWNRYYKPRNATLALAGALDPAAARAAITAYFGSLPGGEAAPTPNEPRYQIFSTTGQTIESPIPGAYPMACVGYTAPQPGSDLYAPLLVLVSRLLAAASKLGEGGPTGSPVYFAPLDDGTVVAVSAKVQSGESNDQAIGRLEAFVAETIAPKLRDSERAAARQQFARLLGLGDLPDIFLVGNPYGVALSLARREQWSLDVAKLNRALDALTEQDLRRAAAEIFATTHHSGFVIRYRK